MFFTKKLLYMIYVHVSGESAYNRTQTKNFTAIKLQSYKSK